MCSHDPKTKIKVIKRAARVELKYNPKLGEPEMKFDKKLSIRKIREKWLEEYQLSKEERR